LIRTLHEGLLADGDLVPITKLCAWFGVPRRTVYYKQTTSPPKLDDKFVLAIKALSEEEPSFGYRSVAWLLGFNSEAPNAIGSSEWAEHRATHLSNQRLASSRQHPADAPAGHWDQPTYAGSGLERTAGRRWRLSWIATHATYWAGIYRVLARQALPCRRLNTH